MIFFERSGVPASSNATIPAPPVRLIRRSISSSGNKSATWASPRILTVRRRELIR